MKGKEKRRRKKKGSNGQRHLTPKELQIQSMLLLDKQLEGDQEITGPGRISFILTSDACPVTGS